MLTCLFRLLVVGWWAVGALSRPYRVKTTALYRPALLAVVAHYLPAPITPLARY